MKIVSVLFVVLFSIFVASCEKGSVNDTKAIPQSRDVETFKMTVTIVDETKIKKVCTDLGVNYDANGCASYNFETNHCTIYVMPQRFSQDKERLEIIGHEVWHCRYGVWHD